MNETLIRRARVPAEMAGDRFDQIAARLFDDFSRARLQAWIRSGELRLDGVVCKPRERVMAGAELQLHARIEAVIDDAPDPRALPLIYQDEHLLVLNKPAGWVVHPGAGNRSGTLLNVLLAHDPDLAVLPRAGIVHRLDRDTSGLMVVARSLVAHTRLVRQLAARTVCREYFAICRGALSGGGTIDAPIGRHPRQRTQMAVLPGGRPAVTHFRIAQRFAHFTAVTVRLETGRTHQIRVHFAHRRNPLLGDPVYGGRLQLPAGASPELLTALREFPRQALHAQRLGFDHPVSGEPVIWEVPLPDDLQTLLAVLQREDPWQQG
jgi:23S rRNA pseudouridine1911/1915/1917 synthase